MPDIDLGRPEPVLARAGDIVLSHYQLAHAAGPNTSPHVRYAVYFRLKRKGHDRSEVGVPDRRVARVARAQRALTGISRSAVPLRHQPSRCEQ